MILDNITLNFPSTLTTKRSEFIALYGSDMILLFDKKKNDESIKGYSSKHSNIIKYWAVFSLCVILKNLVTITGNGTFSYYDDIYDLTTINTNLQKDNIDITKVYAIFDLFGYSN